MKWLIGALFWFLSVWQVESFTGIGPIPSHAIYLAVIEVSPKQATEPATIRVKVFADDLQDALRNASPNYRPGEVRQLMDLNRAIIQQYFSRHLLLYVNESSVPLRLISGKVENDAFWLLFKGEGPEHWRTLKLTADFFMELFPTQTNVLKVEYGSIKKFARLNKAQSHCELQLD